MGPPELVRPAKNTGTRNEIADFKKFEIEHTKRIKTIAAHRPQVFPRRGITLQARRSTSHLDSEARPQGNEIRASEDLRAH